MNTFCHSCAAPTDIPAFRGPSDLYCRYCSDEQGQLKTRTDVQQGIAAWLRGWQPDLDPNTALARAGDYMKAMPAWADSQ